MITARVKKIKYGAAAIGVLLGMMTLGGCGRNESADMAQSDLPGRQEEPEEGELEENSLARWEASLEEGILGELSAPSIRGISVIDNDSPYFAVSYEPRAYKNSFDCWAISVPYQSMVAVDTEAIYDYFQVLADMELTPVEDMALEQAGIDDSENRIYVAYYKEQTAEGGQAEPDRGISYRFGGQNQKGDYYVEVSGQLYTADADTIRRLFDMNPYDCVLKVVSVVKVETVSGVEIAFDDNRYEMQAEQGTFRFNEKDVDSSVFYELYTDLMSIFIEEEIPADAGGNTDGELLMTITYHRNMQEAPQITQRYYAYDEDYAAVQVNGTRFFLVSREALAQLKERIAAAYSL